MIENIKKLKVITVVGTRPEIIRLSRIISKLDQYCDHILVHTGQNYDYELSETFFEDLQIRKPDIFLNAAGKTGSETIGNVIIEVDKVFQKHKPEAVLILGDTNSCMAVLPAKRLKIPTFHMEAGNRCFDMRVPEEINRRIVDHTADINLTYSSIAREYLLKEGLPADLIIKTGSPMFEVLKYNSLAINKSKILNVLNIKNYKYFLVSAHREENIDFDKNFSKLILLLNGISEEYNLPVIVSTHPRTRNKIQSKKIIFHEKIRLIKPLNFSDYNKLQINAKAVLSDSGTITEESSILNFPAVNIREAHERPEGMEEASVMMVGLELERVKQALNILASQCRGKKRDLDIVSDFNTFNVSSKIIRLIYSYTDYINRVVWKKY